LVEAAHIVIGVGEDDPAGIRLGGAITVPVLDQRGACDFSRIGNMHSVMLGVSLDCVRRSPGGELPRGIALPVFTLAANVGNLDMAIALGDRAKRRPRLDRLQLFGIADQHHLGAALLC